MNNSGIFFAVLNPAAGGGRWRKLVGPALDRLRAGGIEIKVVETNAPGQATLLAKDAYDQGYRKFIAIGGDGTSYEIVNGIFPSRGERPTLAFLPLGTGNSFLRDFSDRGVEFAIDAEKDVALDAPVIRFVASRILDHSYADLAKLLGAPPCLGN